MPAPLPMTREIKPPVVNIFLSPIFLSFNIDPNNYNKLKVSWLQLSCAGITGLKALAAFYPEHIRKEDKVFFPSTEKYFTTEELDAMLEEFWAFDRSLIHEKYKNVVEQI